MQARARIEWHDMINSTHTHWYQRILSSINLTAVRYHLIAVNYGRTFLRLKKKEQLYCERQGPQEGSCRGGGKVTKYGTAWPS